MDILSQTEQSESNDAMSQKIKESELKEGDHIYTWRKHIHSHHGIFIGEGKIVHFVNTKKDENGQFSASSSVNGMKKTKTPCQSWQCESNKIAGGGVRMTCVNCFKKKGSLYRFKYEATREFLRAKHRGGICTTARSDSPKEVIHRANYLHKNGYVEYDVMNNNCEDFALYCKTGLWSNDRNCQGRSSQANIVHPTEEDEGKLKKIMQRLATMIPRSQYLKRENNDLGDRQDVVKVHVEELSSFLRTL